MNVLGILIMFIGLHQLKKPVLVEVEVTLKDPVVA